MYVMKNLGKAIVIGTAVIAGACTKPGSVPEANYERVVSDELIPQHKAASEKTTRTQFVYRANTRDADGNLKHYELSDGNPKTLQEAANDIDIGDEIRVKNLGENASSFAPSTKIGDVDIRDNYVTGHVTTKDVCYYRNSASVTTKGELVVHLIDLNDHPVELKYEGNPITIQRAYVMLGPATELRCGAPKIDPKSAVDKPDITSADKPIVQGRLIKLPRNSADLAAALYDP